MHSYPEHRHHTQAAGNLRYTPSAVTDCMVAKCMSNYNYVVYGVFNEYFIMH